ncbi:MAG: hypothetical protein ACRERC_17825 [Candidatus Binatia bacterium]
MSIWSRLFGRPLDANVKPVAPPARGPIPLPTDPFVFECRVCHKVFEARRRRPSCPECDSQDVEVMSA